MMRLLKSSPAQAYFCGDDVLSIGALSAIEENNLCIPDEIGIIGFNDVGRVWLEGENSKRWHHGYGGGVWIAPFSVAVLTAEYEMSKDELSGLFTMRFKYLF